MTLDQAIAAFEDLEIEVSGDGFNNQVIGWLKELRQLREKPPRKGCDEKLVRALTFYADPETYHACSFYFDPPTGGWDTDFDYNHGNDFYQREMPGKRARAAIQELKGRKIRVRGHLIKTGGTAIGWPTLRVYGEHHSAENPDFTDFEIHHSDLEVEIVGEFDFYKRDDKPVIDHSREVLGREEDD